MDKTPIDLLKSHFGYVAFRPLQEEIIAAVLARKDTVVLMPTGGGKSLCYQLPALCFDGLTLVVSPLIALMKDQVDALKANGIASEFINSSLHPREVARVQAQAAGGLLKILYLAPERLALSRFRSFLRTITVSLIAIDEAHCISEWGHDFRPDYRDLRVLRRDFPSVPIIALTATATERVRDDIVTQLALPEAETFISSFNRPNLTYKVQPKRNAFDTLLRLLRRYHGEPAIIYRFSRKDTEELAASLVDEGLNALPYHAGLDGSLRNQTQERFSRDEVPIIVATIAFGMGIDKPDIRLIVHYDMPKTIEGYYQETGRAGRDALPSECVLFYSYSDKFKHDFFINKIEDDVRRESSQEKLRQVVQYGELQTCRRRFLLEYFGEEWEAGSCGACDVCLAPRDEIDATEIARKVLSAVVRVGQRFGAGHVSEVLRGAKTQRVLRLGHAQLTVYGIVRDLDDFDLKDLMAHLVTRGLLQRNGTERPTLSVTQAGWAFLKNGEHLTLPDPRRGAEDGETQDSREPAYDRGLFDDLRLLRNGIARDEDVPPYVIFGNAALEQMATYFPQSPESFSLISGVGKAKLARLGERFLSVIQDYAQRNGLVEREIPRRGRRRRLVQRLGPTYEETRSLFLQGLSPEEIAERRQLSGHTIIGHLERLVQAGDALDLMHAMPPPERLRRIEAAFQRSGDLKLVPVKELLGEDFSYEEIRVVRIGLKQRWAPER
ncbi:MAG: DNA helicase RecQ [Chloroflexi bacterium]|nr:DNA helicase RecQ [Chloroflexota bacterium]